MSDTALRAFELVLAGIGGGLAGSVAGLASLVSYPALLALGIPALSANVTNTVGLVFSGAGSIWGSRPELAGQRRLARLLVVPAAAGGLAGGALLLATPSGQFTRIVPWLIGSASLAVLLRRQPAPLAGAPPALPNPAAAGVAAPLEDGAPPTGAPAAAIFAAPPPTAPCLFALSIATGQGRPRLLAVGVFAIALYGGYFGAAAGVVLLAVLLAVIPQSMARSNAMKNLLLGLANTVAAAAFVAFGPVRWSAVLPLGAGFLIGGRIGPPVVRRAPAAPLRVLIAFGGLALALHLGLDAYS